MIKVCPSVLPSVLRPDVCTLRQLAVHQKYCHSFPFPPPLSSSSLPFPPSFCYLTSLHSLSTSFLSCPSPLSSRVSYPHIHPGSHSYRYLLSASPSISSHHLTVPSNSDSCFRFSSPLPIIPFHPVPVLFLPILFASIPVPSLSPSRPLSFP